MRNIQLTGLLCCSFLSGIVNTPFHTSKTGNLYEFWCWQPLINTREIKPREVPCTRDTSPTATCPILLITDGAFSMLVATDYLIGVIRG